MDAPDHYYEVRLLPEHREALLRFLSGEAVSDMRRREVLVRVKAAKRYDLPPVEVDWDGLVALASKRGSTLAELFYDNPPKKKRRPRLGP